MPSVGKNVEQLELLCTVVGVWYNYSEQQISSFLKT